MGLLTGAGDGSSVLGSFSLFSVVVGVTGVMTLSGGSAEGSDTFEISYTSF